MISPKLVEVGRHINIELHTCSNIEKIDGQNGNFQVTLHKIPRYIDSDKCTACGDCVEVCPVTRPSEYDTELVDRKAVYKLYAQAIPGSFAIEKFDKAPCTNACPNNVNAHGYVAMISQGKHQEALEVITRTLPLPGVIGRICPHPCEEACRRKEVDEAISICALKRFAADQIDIDKLPLPEITPRDEKVAIIGAGPAGLTAAYFLAKDGFKVTIFEALPVAGGMLRVGIPDYRLPPEILEKEIKWITRLGVEIKFNTALGRDITIDALMDDGYKSVYLAIGCHADMKLNIPNEDAEGVIPGVKFLRDSALYDIKELKGKVVIVGGGDVAIDAARSALRLGAEKVSILYRRTRTEMPARDEEVEDALEEGIDIQFLVAPVEVVEKDGMVAGFKCIKMELGEPDESGRRRPVPVEGSEFVVDTDIIIPAIGQRTDPSFLEGSTDVEINQWNNIEVDPISFETKRKGVFAGGDAQTGPSIAIEAVAAGREAAVSIARYLNGEDIKEGREPFEAPQENFNPIKEDIEKAARAKMSKISMDERKKSFAEVEIGLSEEQAIAEAEKCLDCMVCCECYQCVKACEAEAVTIETHAQQEETITINVGSVILAPGFQPFDPSKFENYNYANHPNVITSTEFERILSATGPFMGHLSRISDKKEPRKIAWFQCIGSRDLNRCDNPYCSSVCCMYAVKEAVVAKEHADYDLDCAIFFMDMRTPGKDFEKYYNDAKDKHGVRFIRSRVHTIDPVPGTDDLEVRYATDSGEVKNEIFDMIVLSVGMETSPETIDLANNLGIDLTEGNFCGTTDFQPFATSKDGIFVCGAFQGPKDIPESVMEASAAACGAGVNLAPARGSLVKEKEFPDESDVTGEEPRIGVFVCNCGINIGGIADVPAIAGYARGLPNVVYVEENLFTCSQDTQDKMVEVIKEQNLNRVVVAACTPTTHELLFQETLRNAGINAYLFDMANIRNQCTWVHSDDKKNATGKSKDLVRMAVARASLLEQIPDILVDVNQSALVIGGGVAGMTAALSLADQGFPATIVEKSSLLGGAARDLTRTWKGQNIQEYLSGLVDKVEQHSDIKVLLNAEVVGASGFVGNFETQVAVGNETKTVEHGVTIIATGGKAADTDEYLFGKNPRVTRWHELEHDPEKLKNAESIVFIQCVGSRDQNRPYCSRICCMASILQAISIKENNPDTNVFILYRDIRTYGEKEYLYKKAREMGVVFVRYSLDNKPKVTEIENGLEVVVFDPILQKNLKIKADYVNLATAIEPAENAAISEFYKIPLNAENFFMEAHAKLRPVEFANDGIFLCGLAHYPKTIEESISQAMAAASKATTVLAKGSVQISPLVSQVDAEKCIGCGLCEEICPFNAIVLEEIEGKGYRAKNISAACKGCGLCASSCPQQAIDMLHFRDQQIVASVCAAV